MATVTVKVAVTAEDAEVVREVAEVKAEGEAQEEAESEVAITINLAAVLTYKVLTAKSKADVVFTSMWLLGGIFFAGAAVIALLALGVALEWPRCFHENSHDSCRAGQVCVSENFVWGNVSDYSSTAGFKAPVCWDCYYFAETNGTLSAPDDVRRPYSINAPAVGLLFGTDNTTTSEFCLEILNEYAAAIEFANSIGARIALPSQDRASFARCLYIQETLGKESDLDSFILLVVFVLVALSMAEDQRQQQLMCRLRRILLPLPLRPKKKATGSVLRWLGILLLTINEFVISLVAPMLPFGVVFLMLTQGIDVASALLNGLAVSFLLQIDDLVPSIFLSPKTLSKIETYLVGEAVREMAKKDAAGFYGYIKASPFIAAATVVMGFITQVYVLNASRSVTCAALLYLLHYRATIFFGLWCTGALYLATEAGTRAIIGLQQRQLSPSDSSRASVDINEDAPVPSASGVPKWVAPVLTVLVRRIVYLLAAAFTLNVLFFFLIRGSFYGDDFFDALMNPMHETFLFDLLGTCAQGSNYAGTSCLPF